MADLSCYRIRDNFFGGEPLDFDAVVDRSEREIQEFGPIEGPDFLAKLFVTETPPVPPRWAGFLQQGFDDFQPRSRPSIGALLLIELDDPDRMFAMPFGPAGRFLLRSESFERNYGIRAALNLISPAGSSDDAASSIRSVDTSNSSGPTPLRSRRQTSRDAPLEDFDVDQMREILRQVVGRPADRDHWGHRVYGADPLAFGTALSFEDVGSRCREIDDVARKDDYQERFSFVDNLRQVREPSEVERLETVVIDELRLGDPAQLFELAPPDILDWEQIRAFRFSFDPSGKNAFVRPHIALEHYLAHSKVKDRLGLDLLLGHQLVALDSDGHRVNRWPIWRCLSGTFDSGSDTYVLDNGEIYEVAPSYLAELNESIAKIRESSVVLPPHAFGTTEGDYNVLAADNDPDLLLLDKRLVRAGSLSTAIEICDLLSTQRQLIHVKRHFSSSSLSHLFNQGLVSGEMLLQDSDFRAAAVLKIELDGDSHAGVIPTDTFRPQDYEIVYSVIGDWKGRELVERLPLFSRITLRHAATTLERMGFTVTFCKIHSEATE